MFRGLKRFIRTNRTTTQAVSAFADYPMHDKEVLRDAYFAQIIKLKRAFEELRKRDSQVTNIALSPYKEMFVVNIGSKGEYSLRPNYDLSLVYLSSPESGFFSYYFDPEEMAFVHTVDKHRLEEFLAREILRVLKTNLPL